MALPDLVPPSATVLVGYRFVVGEPVGATETILADLTQRFADRLYDLLANPLTPLPCADILDRRIAELIQESTTISGPKAIHRFIGNRGVKLSVVSRKHQTRAAIHGSEVGRATAADPCCVWEVRTKAATVNRGLLRGAISIGAVGWWRRAISIGAIRRWGGTISIGAIRRRWWTVSIRATGHIRGFSNRTYDIY